MKKYFSFLATLWGIQFCLFANPVDDTPVAKFSELVFDNNNNWIMEIYLPFAHNNYAIDSIVIKIGGIGSRLKMSFPQDIATLLIASDSLEKPLSINRNGDKIVIYIYSNLWFQTVRQDSIIFGDYPGATVGKPDSVYSISRYCTRLASNNYWSIDYLTKNSSLGTVNSIVGESGTLTGHIYDKNGKLITNCYYSTSGQGIFLLEYIITFNPDGTYTTPIFNTIYTPNILQVRIVSFEFFGATLSIEPFELNYIHPDTTVTQDIHLTSDCGCCDVIDEIEKSEVPRNNELRLINYPNPFNPTTNFFIKIPDNLKGKPASISIFNVNGQLIKKIAVVEGTNTQWNGKDFNGRMAASGVYYYSLNINNQLMKTGSMILLK